MQIPFPQFWLTLLLVGTVAGSAGVWFAIAVRWHNDGAALLYEPRRQVPWNVFGAIPALCLASLAAYAALLGIRSEPAVDESNVLWQAIGSIITLATLASAMAVVLVGVFHATIHDLGLPRNRRELVQDARLGFLGFLAAIVPVAAVQFVSVKLSQNFTQHPLIDSIIEDSSSTVLIGAFIAAVIVAPLVEEFVFRVLLQGWLERLEFRVSNALEMNREDSPPEFSPLPSDSPEISEPPLELLDDSAGEFPRRGLIPGVGLGIIPIVASSFVFAIAHLGHGVAPFAIFVLALFLGYLYRQTHRVVPCIVLHMVFNAMNLLLLWLQLQVPRPIFLPELE